MYLLVEPENTGTNAVAMGVEDFAVGGCTPDHAHANNDEIFFVISGTDHGEAAPVFLDRDATQHELPRILP